MSDPPNFMLFSTCIYYSIRHSEVTKMQKNNVKMYFLTP